MTGSPAKVALRIAPFGVTSCSVAISPDRLRSTSSTEPCFKTFAGKTTPAMRALIFASKAVKWAAVMTNPDFRYTPEPDCTPSRIIPAVAIQGRLPSLRSAPSEAIGAENTNARQSADAKRTWVLVGKIKSLKGGSVFVRASTSRDSLGEDGRRSFRNRLSQPRSRCPDRSTDSSSATHAPDAPFAGYLAHRRPV